MFATITNALQIGILVWYGYWLIISLFGFGKAKAMEMRDPKSRFLILVPAHNEEAVIADLLDNLNQLDYPKHLYDVCLIADNCSDGTAAIGYAKGVTVLEHTYMPGEPKGKPYAMKYAFDMMDLSQYDAFCVFDADNLVTLNYLKEMNNHLLEGHKIVQCYLDTKNPKDNFITLSYATSYYMMNRSWQLAKSRLKLGNAIGGTGFCVHMDLLDEIGWTARSLTEDLEFTMQALLKGVKTHWSHYSKVYDEKPTNFWFSCIQRLRWARGHWDVCFKYSMPLLWKAIRDRDMCALDGAMYLLNPGKVVVATLVAVSYYSVLSTNVVLYTAEMGLGWDTLMHAAFQPLYKPFVPMWVYGVMIAFNLVYISIALRDSMQRINPIKAYLSLLFISYTYIPLFMWSLVTFTKRVWVRTEHTKSKSLEEVQAQEVGA
jgi:cellulose synthase/poly-beta-1,6-N-acetylglucosamine synthase-like glycosyltransferase